MTNPWTRSLRSLLPGLALTLISTGISTASHRLANEGRFATNHGYNDAAATLAGLAPAVAAMAVSVAAAGALYVFVVAAQVGWGLGGAIPVPRGTHRPDLATFADTLDEVASVLHTAQEDVRASESQLRRNRQLIALSHEQADAVRVTITEGLGRGRSIDRWIGVIGVAVGVAGIVVAVMLAP
jgi:hypothetical protein